MKALQNQLLVALTDDGKGHIWIGTENEGIYLLDGRKVFGSPAELLR